MPVDIPAAHEVDEALSDIAVAMLLLGPEHPAVVYVGRAMDRLIDLRDGGL